MRRLIAETEAACDELLVEAAGLANHPPLPPTAVKRLRELGIEVEGLSASATLALSARLVEFRDIRGAEFKRNGADQAVDLRYRSSRWRSAR